MAEEQQQDIDSLKRRGRRRLVGAVALVLAAVIVLPMIFDPAPKSSAPPVSVRIPGEDETAFKPKLPAKAEPTPRGGWRIPGEAETPFKPRLRAKPEPTRKAERKVEGKPEAAPEKPAVVQKP